MAEKSADDSKGGLEDCIFNFNQEIVYHTMLSDYELGSNKRKIPTLYFLITKAQAANNKSGFGYDVYICPVSEEAPGEVSIVKINPSINALVENFLAGEEKSPRRILELPESYHKLMKEYQQLTGEHEHFYCNLNRTPKSKRRLSKPRVGCDKITGFSKTMNEGIDKLDYEMNKIYFETFLRQYGKEWIQNLDNILRCYNLNKAGKSLQDDKKNTNI